MPSDSKLKRVRFVTSDEVSMVQKKEGLIFNYGFKIAKQELKASNG